MVIRLSLPGNVSALLVLSVLSVLSLPLSPIRLIFGKLCLTPHMPRERKKSTYFLRSFFETALRSLRPSEAATSPKAQRTSPHRPNDTQRQIANRPTQWPVSKQKDRLKRKSGERRKAPKHTDGDQKPNVLTPNLRKKQSEQQATDDVDKQRVPRKVHSRFGVNPRAKKEPQRCAGTASQEDDKPLGKWAQELVPLSVYQ